MKYAASVRPALKKATKITPSNVAAETAALTAVGKMVDCPQASWDFGVVFYMEFSISRNPPQMVWKDVLSTQNVFYQLYSMDGIAGLMWYPKIIKSSPKILIYNFLWWRFVHFTLNFTSSRRFSHCHSATIQPIARQLKKSSIEPNWSCQALRSWAVKISVDRELFRWPKTHDHFTFKRELRIGKSLVFQGNLG